MSKPQLTEREQRRRRYRRRRRIVLLVGTLLVIGVLALLIWLISLLGGLLFGNRAEPASDQPATVTTTTYPTLDASDVAEHLYMTPDLDVSEPSDPDELVIAQVNATSILLYDETHDTILYQSNPDAVAYPASLTKVVTAAVAATYCPADATFAIGTEQELVEFDASTAYLQEDTWYSLPAMLDALLLPSGADAAYCLAVNTARIHENNPNLSDEEALDVFRGYMNDFAANLGCTSTHFVTPDGYHHSDHYTTASDMLKIIRYAYSLDLIRESVSQSESVYGDWRNGNELVRLDKPEHYYAYATGVKTGFTDEARYCLAAAAEKDDVRLFAILLGGDNPDFRFLDAVTLFERGFELAEEQRTIKELRQSLLPF